MSLPSLIPAAAAPTPSVTDWLGVILSSVAIAIGLAVAYFVWRQSQRFHAETQGHSRETYSRDRYEHLTATGVEILDAARTVQTITSNRLNELIAVDSTPVSPADDGGREQVRATLAVLETRIDMLALTKSLLPVPTEHATDAVDQALRTLHVEAAWLLGDAYAAAISHFGDPEFNPDLGGTREEVTAALVEASMMNLPWRLLFGTRDVPFMGQPGSPWEEAITKRRTVVMEGRDAGTVMRTQPTDDHLNLMFAESIARFSEALFAVVDTLESARGVSAAS